MTHTHSIRKMLEIKDENIEIDDKLTEETIKNVRTQVFHGTLTYTPKGCVNCGMSTNLMRIS